jgi:hypothetical protein
VQDVAAVEHLRGIDVLVASPAFGALFLQHDLMRAAQAAGVRLFVPGEWGDTTDGRTEPIFKLKQEVRADAAALGLQTATFFAGVWTENLLHLGFDLPASTITIKGDGGMPVSMTSLDDIVRFAAHVLIHLPPSELENTKFTLEGDRIVSGAFRTEAVHTADARSDLQPPGRGFAARILTAADHQARPAEET